MTNIIITALLILSAICSLGQRNFAIKIYQNTDIFEIQYYERITNAVEIFDEVHFTRLSLAVDMETKKGFTHEIEFLIPEVSKSFDNIQYPMNYVFQKKAPDFDGQVSSYSLRYEFSKTLTNKNKRLGFDLGIGINPYYVLVEYIPTIETRYYSSTKLYGFVLNMVPRIKYKLSPRFSIDFNVPLNIYDLRAEKFRVKNPAIPIDQQMNNRYRHIFFESTYTFRVGLMYKLSK